MKKAFCKKGKVFLCTVAHFFIQHVIDHSHNGLVKAFDSSIRLEILDQALSLFSSVHNEISLLRNFRIQQLRPMIEMLRMPVHTLIPLLISFSIHILD